MNILFLFVSLPNLEQSNTLFPSLISEFKIHGHRVLVSTKGRDNDNTHISVELGIPVLRIKSHDFTGVKSSIKKAIAYQEYTLKQVHQTIKYFGNEKIDLIITHSLPPELAYIVGRLKKYFGCPAYLIHTDFTWQDAVAFKYFSKNSIIAWYYRFWEKLLFKRVNYIACPTQGNIAFIKQYYPKIDDSKFRLLPFWQNPISIKIPSKDQIKDKYGLKNKFVVVYGGSVGAAQKIEHIIELAETCNNYEDIVFVILGKGVYLDKIKKMALDLNLSNVVFKEFLPQDEYLQFLSSCDVGLIVLNENMATPNFPSKSLSYLNMKVPILAALDYTTDFGSYLESYEAGLWAHSDDINTLKTKLLKYYSSPDFCEHVKEKGYSLFINHLTPQKAYNTIINDFSY